MLDNLLFQLLDVKEDENHAGSKATSDVAKIAEEKGFKIIPIVNSASEITRINAVKRQINYISEWDKAYKEIPECAIVLIQEPFVAKQLNRNKVLYKLKKEKNVKFIAIVHDVMELRFKDYPEHFKKDFEMMLEIADVMIVHNEIMKNWFIQRGVEENKLVTLEIFDYLCDESKIKVDKSFEKCLNIAGNLDISKSSYIAKLGKLKDIKFKLYGPNFNEGMKRFENIDYQGSFPSGDIPGMLNTGFGLVWDGTSIDTCEGDFGRYLKYNNPHKLSLYLASGLPVVIWNEAAEADFVKDNMAGICVDSLNDLSDVIKYMTEEDYKEMCANAQKIGQKLRDGFYFKKALDRALNII